MPVIENPCDEYHYDWFFLLNHWLFRSRTCSWIKSSSFTFLDCFYLLDHLFFCNTHLFCEEMCNVRKFFLTIHLSILYCAQWSFWLCSAFMALVSPLKLSVWTNLLIQQSTSVETPPLPVTCADLKDISIGKGYDKRTRKSFDLSHYQQSDDSIKWLACSASGSGFVQFIVHSLFMITIHSLSHCLSCTV